MDILLKQTDMIASIETTDCFATVEKLNVQLQALDSQLEQLTCQADMKDYALAVMCGTLSGALDSLWLGSTTVTAEDISLSREQISTALDKMAERAGSKSKSHSGNISFFEKMFDVPQDAIWKGKGINVSASNHHLADLAHHPTPVGLLSAIIIQFLRVATFVNKEGKWHLVFVKPEKKDMLRIYLPVILTGFLTWLTILANEKSERLEEAPEVLRKLIALMAATPLLIEIIQLMVNWLGHFISDVDGSKNTPGAGMGIPGLFLSMLQEIAAIPPLNLCGIQKVLEKRYVKDHMDLRVELPLAKLLVKQSIPVAVNELLTRACFFITRLQHEIQEKGTLSMVDWDKVIPVGNRTVDRMITVSCMTFSFADAADATLRGLIESRGDFVLFVSRFSARINYVGAVRTGIAIVRELSDEHREMQLIKEKRILTEERAAVVLEELAQYEEMLVSIISKYLVDDLKDYMAAIGDIRTGLVLKDSDMVIRGNMLIQKKFGREAQFHNQDEFDVLMESDTSFVF